MHWDASTEDAGKSNLCFEGECYFEGEQSFFPTLFSPWPSDWYQQRK